MNDMNDMDSVRQLLTVTQAPGQCTALITSPKELARLEIAYLALQDQYTGPHDGPRNDAEFSAYVVRVSEAIVDVLNDGDAFESAGKAKTAVKFIRELPAFVVQLTAAKIVMTVSSIQSGIYTLPSWEAGKALATIKFELFQTFELRLQAVLAVLVASKNIYKNLFDGQIT